MPRDPKDTLSFTMPTLAHLGLDTGALSPKLLDRAVRRAVGKLARQVNTAGSREARKTWNVKAKTLKRSTSIVDEYDRYRRFIIQIRGLRLSLGEFSSLQQNEIGVLVKLKKGRKAEQTKHTFLIPGAGHVYIRAKAKKSVTRRVLSALLAMPSTQNKRVKRHPLWRVYGPSAAFMYRSKTVRDKMITTAEAKAASILRHEIEWEIKKALASRPTGGA